MGSLCWFISSRTPSWSRPLNSASERQTAKPKGMRPPPCWSLLAILEESMTSSHKGALSMEVRGAQLLHSLKDVSHHPFVTPGRDFFAFSLCVGGRSGNHTGPFQESSEGWNGILQPLPFWIYIHYDEHITWKWMAWPLGRLLSFTNRRFSTSM